MPTSRMSNSAACVPLIVAFSNLRPPRDDIGRPLRGRRVQDAIASDAVEKADVAARDGRVARDLVGQLAPAEVAGRRSERSRTSRCRTRARWRRAPSAPARPARSARPPSSPRRRPSPGRPATPAADCGADRGDRLRGSFDVRSRRSGTSHGQRALGAALTSAPSFRSRSTWYGPTTIRAPSATPLDLDVEPADHARGRPA